MFQVFLKNDARNDEGYREIKKVVIKHDEVLERKLDRIKMIKKLII